MISNIFLPSLLCLLAIAPNAGKEKSCWVVEKSSSLQIVGKTNISKWSCGVAEYAEPDTITFFDEGCRGQVRGIPLCGIVRINIGDFDCRNSLMTGEFKKTLQYKQYPQLTISFLNLDRMPDAAVKGETLSGEVMIALAGVAKKVVMRYSSTRVDATTIELTGEQSFCFADFGLTPPRKMGGLIRVSEGLDVRFLLCLHRINH